MRSNIYAGESFANYDADFYELGIQFQATKFFCCKTFKTSSVKIFDFILFIRDQSEDWRIY